MVAYQTPDPLQRCLASLHGEGAAIVVVADNGADDETPRVVLRELPQAMYRNFADNPGYGAAVNRVRADVDTPFLVILNADTELDPGALRALGTYLERHPNVGLVGPRLRNADGSLQPSCYPTATPWQLLLQESRFGALTRWVPWVRRRHLRTWPHDYDRRVPWVLGAALAIRLSAFDAVGGFDESYFLYYEEVDLCHRLGKAGWEVHFTPTAEVIHHGGVSTSTLGPAVAQIFFTSAARFHRTHRGAGSWIAFRAVVVAVAAAQLARCFVSGCIEKRSAKRVSRSATVRAWRAVLHDALTGWPAEQLESRQP
ncbi:MAG: glycosyltransferase family 2 protein [Acidimicrobiales bacterium]